MNSINDGIQAIRNGLKKNNLHGIIIPSNDPHQSEYVSDYWKIREHFSGFTGSAGTLVVTQNEAAIWTDSRYFLQAEKQCLGTVVELQKQSIPHAPEHIPWLCNLLEKKSIIGIDYRLFSSSQMDYLLENASEKEIAIESYGTLIDDIWENRSAQPNGLISDYSIDFCGKDRMSKINEVKTELSNKGADFNFISSLDETCWLLNIRSADVDFTPLVISYTLIGNEKSYLFVHENRIEPELMAALNQDGIEVLSYDSIRTKLAELTLNKKVIASSSTLNYACFTSLEGELISRPSLVQHLKSIKNETEIANAKNGMVKDGVALTQFFIWLESHLESNTISEYDLGIKLESFRMKQEFYKYQSFGAIVGYKSNGAIIHYSAPKKGSSMISNDGVLLLDSGAQYENATTDITRTIWLGGTPSSELKKAYTLVLKGHIELDRAVFPKGTTGIQLDSFARMHLWKHGLTYAHGTGHGIGSYSAVHEPAQGFAARMTTYRGGTPHMENQFTTIEPGYYKEGEFGIRTENVVVSKEKFKSEHGSFIGFEPITLCPIDTELIDRSLISDHEIDWLNKYHQKVYDDLATHLTESEKTWLKQKCLAI
ncbi:MAG: aminopeptidase P family protein [Crocinitomicaceae bacterium]|nr:aminopeptidase P family protein [Crocinitomicaceae bacterium]